MSAHAYALTGAVTGGPDRALLYPWGLGEIRAGLALCPPGAFHLTGLRLERLDDGDWWAELAGYRDDFGAPFVWPGFRVRRGRGWDVTPPPYLADLGGAWRSVVFGAVQRLTAIAFGDPAGLRAPALFVAVERPSGPPGPGHAGREHVTPIDPSLGRWLALARRYRLAAELARDATVLVAGAGGGARTVARLAHRAVAVHASRDVIEYAARVYRAPRLTFAAADHGRLPFAGGVFDAVISVEGEAALAEVAGLAELMRVVRPDGRLIVALDPAAVAPVRATLAGWCDEVETVDPRAPAMGDSAIDSVPFARDQEAATVIVLAHRRPAAAADWQRQGSELLAAGRVAEALPLFAAVLQREPDNVTALVGAAHCALVVDHTVAARGLLGRVLALDPSHVGARAALAELDTPVGTRP